MSPADRLGIACATYVRTMCRARWIVFGAFLVLCLGLVPPAFQRLGINSDTADMISERLPWRQVFNDYRRQFPAVTDSLLILVEGESEGRVDRAADRLVAALEAEPLFHNVDRPGGGPFFDRNGLLFVDGGELQALIDRASRIQPLAATLRGNRDLVEFLTLVARGADQADGLDDTVLASLETGLGRVLAGSDQPVEWSDDDGTEPQRALIVSQPVQDFASWTPGRAAMSRVEEVVADLGLADAGVTVAMTGPVALQTEELSSVAEGALLAGILALLMVAGVLWLCLRSLVLVVAALITLLVGLALTAAFAGFAVGHLNLISVAFAVLYIGLGIDFAIHLSLRYREALVGAADRISAVAAAAADVGASLVLCAVTTSIGFYAFFPTEFAGVSELGLISGTGMFISLFVTLSLLPPVLISVPVRESPPDRGSPPLALLGRWVDRHARMIRTVAIVILLLSLTLLPWVRFDSNPMNLRDPDSPSVQAYRTLLEDPRLTPRTLSLLAEPEEVGDLQRRLGALDETQAVVALTDFVPEDQAEKLALIDQLALILGDARATPDEPLPASADVADALASLADGVAEGSAGSERLASLSRELAARLRNRADHDLVAAMDRVLLSELRHRINRLNTALEADVIQLPDLPESLTDRWIAPDGRWRVQVMADPGLAGDAGDAAFVEAVTAVTPDATGLPVVHVRAGEAVVRAFQQAFLTAAVLVFLVLLGLLRGLRPTLLALIPLILATPLTAATAVVLGIPFNFANVITLPLLLGVGVDNGIHMVHRATHALPADGNVLGSSTARAVMFSALTTVVSFGNLAFSPHTGTASMGLMLTVGMIGYLVCTLVFLPAFIAAHAAPNRPRADS